MRKSDKNNNIFKININKYISNLQNNSKADLGFVYIVLPDNIYFHVTVIFPRTFSRAA